MNCCSCIAPSFIECSDSWENPVKGIVIVGVGQMEKSTRAYRHLAMAGIIFLEISDVRLVERAPPRPIELIEFPVLGIYEPLPDEKPYRPWLERGFQKRAKNIPQKRLKLFQWHYQSKKRRGYRPQ